ncbi:MAG: ABC transporter substrate-binding protein [Stutzerimonas stutzeri]
MEEQTSRVRQVQGRQGHWARCAIRWRRTDYSSFLLQAQSSGAKVIGLANAGLDTANAIKQAAEFGIVAGGQRLAALLFTLAEVHGLGLDAAQGLTLTEGFYWDRDDEVPRVRRAFLQAHRRACRTWSTPAPIPAVHAVPQGDRQGRHRRHRSRWPRRCTKCRWTTSSRRDGQGRRQRPA